MNIFDWLNKEQMDKEKIMKKICRGRIGQRQAEKASEKGRNKIMIDGEVKVRIWGLIGLNVAKVIMSSLKEPMMLISMWYKRRRVVPRGWWWKQDNNPLHEGMSNHFQLTFE